MPLLLGILIVITGMWHANQFKRVAQHTPVALCSVKVSAVWQQDIAIGWGCWGLDWQLPMASKGGVRGHWMPLGRVDIHCGNRNILKKRHRP